MHEQPAHLCIGGVVPINVMVEVALRAPWNFRQLALASVPVHAFRFRLHAGGRRHVAVRAVAVPDGTDHGDLPDAPTVDEPFLGLLEMRVAALLRAGLQHALVFPDSFNDLVTLHRMERHRLFDINVFAGAARLHGNMAVGIVPGGDDDSVDVFAVQHTAIVPKLFYRAAGDLRRFISLYVVSIANGHPLVAAGLVGLVH